MLVGDGKSVVLGAADTFRAAAADQLETWGERVGVLTVRGREGGDPASVAFEAVRTGVEAEVDTVVVDTAGRLHTKSGLMDELGKIKRVVEKQAPVTEVLLVLDATTGQNGIVQARVFTEAVTVTGVVLTKLDGTAKGGIVVSVQRELGIPVKLIGLGEGADDLAPFEPRAFAEGLVGDAASRAPWRPALLDAAEPPDRQRARPRRRRTARRSPKPTLPRSSEREPGERAGVHAEPVDEQSGELDAADDQRDRDRQPGDGEVVVDLAHRLEERPAVGEVHEASRRWCRAGSSRRRRGPAAPGSRTRAAPKAAAPPASTSSADLGRGVEAQPEQQAHRVHVPRLADRPGDPAEHPVEKPALVAAAAPARPRRTRRRASAGTPDDADQRRPG